MLLKTVILLRIAAVLMFVHFAGHTIGMFQGPSHGEEEAAVLETMANHHFDVWGSNRSYLDFLRGFGFDASLNMLTQALLFWLLAGVAKNSLSTARPFIALFTLFWVAAFFLYMKYFFVAATVFAILMVIVLAAAWIGASNSARNPDRLES